MESCTNLSRREVEVLVIGGGMSGLTAGNILKEAGRDVLVVDKGRGVGGRMASRRIGEATFDHGAQFLTAKDPSFARTVAGWQKDGVVDQWYRNSNSFFEGHPRWRGRPSMTAIARHLARDLDVRLSCTIESLRCEGKKWIACLDTGEMIQAEAVVLTAPVPQAVALLDAGGIDLRPTTRNRLENLTYERCLAVLAVLDEPSRIPAPGMLRPMRGPIAWIGDNQAKGVSRVPAVTIHATADFSLANWERDRQATGRDLLQAAEPWLGAAVLDFQVHGWRYSKPTTVEESRCLVLSQSPLLVLAGDAFGGPRVEGAALSGRAAAESLQRVICATV